MALTRSMLKGMGLAEEQIETIISEHTSITDALKAQKSDLKEELDKFKKQIDELSAAEKELEDLRKDHVKADEWKQKFEAEHKQFEDYKADIAGKEHTAKLQSAYKKLLAECKVGDKHVDSILRVTDFKDLKLKEDGTFENVDALKEQIGKDWSGFISSTQTRGAGVENPPAGGKTGSGSSRAAELAAKYHDNLYGKTNKEE